jgi:hypothetical protein
MKAARPALAYRLALTEDEQSELIYDDARQISVDVHGEPVIKLGLDRIETLAERDSHQPSTSTRAARDPGDLDATFGDGQIVAETRTLTEADRDRDTDDPDTEASFGDDLVTGVVGF